MSLEQDFALNSNTEQFCDGCGKHCPLSAPGCGYGRKKAQEAGLSVSDGNENHGRRENFSREEDHGRRESFSREEGHGRREGFSREEGHGRREGFSREEGHGREGFGHEEGHSGRRGFEHRGERPHHKQVDYQNTEDLTILLRGCGHYLFHRSHNVMRDLDRGSGYIHDRDRHRNVMGGSQQQILSILSKNGPMAQKDLLDVLMIRPGSLSELLSKLEEKGLLVRQEDENDRRKVILTLTEEGQSAGAGESDFTGEKDLFAVLDEEEKNTLKLLLKKLLGSWE